MDENHRNKTANRPTVTEDKLWLPPLSAKDQKKLDHIRGKGKKSASSWTGFAGRNLWDWLQFFGVLAIPIIVAAGTLYFTQQITLQQAMLSVAANEQQHQTDLEIAADQQRETTLKTYLDDMSDLLLNHHLRQAKPGDEVSQVARERTLTTLRRLDANRNRIMVQFLQEAHLIGGKNAVIGLSNADLSDNDLSQANLSSVNLSNDVFFSATLVHVNLTHANLSNAELDRADLFLAELSYANLSNANLGGAKLALAELSYANLSNANLGGAFLNLIRPIGAIFDRANLSNANLGRADLHRVDLSDADLYRAFLSGADLSEANLSRVRNFTQQQLDQVYTCKGAILPKGLTCHHNQ